MATNEILKFLTFNYMQLFVQLQNLTYVYNCAYGIILTNTQWMHHRLPETSCSVLAVILSTPFSAFTY